jgi:hypothetical protein
LSQEPFDKQQLIAYRLDRAKETLEDAHLLFKQEGSLESVVNRAYYAMFYATLAVLTTVGKGSSKHSGVIALFDRFFVKTGKFPTKMSKALHKAFDLRQFGDYRELVQLDRRQVEETLSSADQYVDNVENFLEVD